jgi:predicted aspartyl protease
MLGLVGVLLASLQSPIARATACELKLLTSLPINTLPTGRISVPATVQGRQTQLMVDTGAVISLLAAGTVADAGLRPQTLHDVDFIGFGGKRITQFVTTPLKLGDLSGEKLYFLVMPSGRLEGDVGGLFGADFLYQYDIELDFVAGKLNIFKPNECDGPLVYWTRDPFAALPMRRAADRQFKINVTMQLDGRPVPIEIDTGSVNSVYSLGAARRLFGWSDPSKMPEMTTTEDGGFRYAFKTLSIEGIEVRNPDIVLYRDSDIRMGAMKNLILGMSVLRQAHLYIAYKDQMLYITPASAH